VTNPMSEKAINFLMLIIILGSPIVSLGGSAAITRRIASGPLK